MSYRGKGDRRFLDYHYGLDPDWWCIDIDAVEVCAICRRPLQLTETTRDPQKATSILRQLARDSSLPAVLVILPDGDDAFSGDERVRWRWVEPVDRSPRGWQTETLADYFRDCVGAIRDAHRTEAHPPAVLAAAIDEKDPRTWWR